MTRIRAHSRTVLNIRIRVRRILHEVGRQFVQRLTAAPGGLRQRIPRAQLDPPVEPTSDPEADALELAAADTHVHRRVLRIQIQVGVPPGPTVNARVQRPAYAEVVT